MKFIAAFTNENNEQMEIYRQGKQRYSLYRAKDKAVVSKLSAEQMIKTLATYANHL